MWFNYLCNFLYIVIYIEQLNNLNWKLLQETEEK